MVVEVSTALGNDTRYRGCYLVDAKDLDPWQHS